MGTVIAIGLPTAPAAAPRQKTTAHAYNPGLHSLVLTVARLPARSSSDTARPCRPLDRHGFGLSRYCL